MLRPGTHAVLEMVWNWTAHGGKLAESQPEVVCMQMTDSYACKWQ